MAGSTRYFGLYALIIYVLCMQLQKSGIETAT